MSFWSDYGIGVSTHLDAIRFVRRHRLWGYFLYPVILLVILAIAGFFSIFAFSHYLTDWLFSFLQTDFHTGEDWLGGFLQLLLWIVKFLASFVIRIYIFLLALKVIRYIVLILCSPMMALLSEKVEELVTGNSYPFNFAQFLKDVLRGVLVNLRNLAFELSITIALLVVGWIPVIGLITVPVSLLVSWYFLGFNMIDYTCERRRMPVSEGARFIRKRKGIAIGNGMIFSWLLLVPFAGLIIAPVLSSVAGTLAALEAMDGKRSQ